MMSSLARIFAQHAVLWAQSDRLNDLGGRFRQNGPNISLWHVFAMLTVIAVTIFALWGITRWQAGRRQHGYRNFHQLFVQLCRLHQIDWSGRRLLTQLARAQGVSYPAQLFLMPERFESTALPAEIRIHETKVRELQQKIFGESPERTAFLTARNH